jgi:hypothetical protein
MKPNIELTAHDRFFTALGAGVMPLSDTNSFIREHFPALAPYTFSFDDGSIEAILEQVFARPADALALAHGTKQEMMPRFSTAQAAKHIRDCAAIADYLDFSFAAPQPFIAL